MLCARQGPNRRRCFWATVVDVSNDLLNRTSRLDAAFESREYLIECFQELEEKCSKTITCQKCTVYEQFCLFVDFVV